MDIIIIGVFILLIIDFITGMLKELKKMGVNEMLLSLSKADQKFLAKKLEEVDKNLLIDGKLDEHGQLMPIIKQLKELEY